VATDCCRHARWGAIGILWVFALWHSWEVRALFNDGAVFFIAAVHQQSPVHFYPARDYAMLAMQLPLTLALRLGVTDLNWLARLLSFGMFALPTAIYHLALVRAREDAALLAAVIMAIAAIFMTTSFSIVGEYNTACALAVLAAVLLTGKTRPSVIDALLLVAVAVFALRVYETFVFLGPALAAMALWTVRRGHCPGDGFAVSGVLCAALLLGFMAVVCLVSLIGRYAVFLPVGLILVVAATWAVVRVSARPLVARGLVVLAAALFAASAAVAVQSLVSFVEPGRLEHAALWTLSLNIQFYLAVGSVLVVAVWALARADDLATNKPYRWAGVGLVLLALSPLMTLAGQTLGAMAYGQDSVRGVAALVVLAMVLVMWAYRSEWNGRPKALVRLRSAPAALRLLTWAFLMLVASLPADVVLTRASSSFLQVMRSTIRDRSGLIPFEETRLAEPSFADLFDGWSAVSQSLAMRSKPGDGIVLPPKDYTGPVAHNPFSPPDLGRYFWRD
jgi:hypothetical protein